MQTELSKPKVTEHVLRAIESTIGSLPAERGGVLGINKDTGIIDAFHFDVTGERSSATYSPSLNALAPLNDAWAENKIKICGFVHSHPTGFTQPSSGDLVYCKDILAVNPKLEAVELPIVQSKADHGTFSFDWWRVSRNGDDAVKAELAPPLVVNSTAPEISNESGESNGEHSGDDAPIDLPVLNGFTLPKCHVLEDGTFDRVKDAYDLPRLGLCRAVVVGVGGAAAFADDLGRAGVRHFVLIDPDVVEPCNLATQHVARGDIGRPKVEALAESLRRNYNAEVIALRKRLEDIPDAVIQRLVFHPVKAYQNLPTMVRHGKSKFASRIDVRLRPAEVLFCGMTDNFFCQARASRIALNLGLPYMAAQVYERGMGAEIVFFHPDGPNVACPRCILKPRYDAYLNEKFVNNVGSSGTPIGATTHLNGVKFTVAMALLHYGTNHSRWGSLLDAIGPNNFIQIRMHPDLDIRPFRRLTEDKPQLVRFGEALFFPQKPVLDCPDCGGSGRIRDAVGRLTDTRLNLQ